MYILCHKVGTKVLRCHGNWLESGHLVIAVKKQTNLRTEDATAKLHTNH